MGVAVVESSTRTPSYFWEKFARSFRNQNSDIYLYNIIHAENIMIQVNVIIQINR